MRRRRCTATPSCNRRAPGGRRARRLRLRGASSWRVLLGRVDGEILLPARHAPQCARACGMLRFVIAWDAPDDPRRPRFRHRTRPRAGLEARSLLLLFVLLLLLF